MKEPERYQRRQLQRDLLPQALQFRHFGTQEELVDQVIDRAVEQAALQSPWPRTEKEFRERLQQARQAFNTACQEMVKLITEILKYWSEVQKALEQHRAYEDAYKDMQAHLRRLMPKAFLRQTDYAQLRHFPRYLRAVMMRMDKLRTDPNRDQRWQAEEIGRASCRERAESGVGGASLGEKRGRRKRGRRQPGERCHDSGR